MEDKIKEILKNKITLINVKERRKVPLIIELLEEFSIENNYKTYLFSLGIRSRYYNNALISKLSGIPKKIIQKYEYPYLLIVKNNQDKIDKEKYIKAIEIIQNSNIYMSDTILFDEDIVDYLLLDSLEDILIIDNLYNFIMKSKYSELEIFKKLEETKMISHIVLFTNTKQLEILNLEGNYKIMEIGNECR